MKNKDYIEVLVKLPKDWVSEDEVTNIFGLLDTFKVGVKRELVNRAVEEIMNKTELPEIEIDREELRKRVMERLADRAIERYDENH